MKRGIFFILLVVVSLVSFVLIAVYINKECDSDADCATKTCFTVECKDNKCVYSPVSDCCGNEICEIGESYLKCEVDCPNCDDKNNCTVDEYDYHEQECIHIPLLDVICCGNGLCELGETYENCTRDCPNCDDGKACTKDSYGYHEQECINEVITPCCGNDICDEDAETYLNCLADCPNCDDNNNLTTDNFNYETQKCENPVTYYFIDDFEGDIKSWVSSGEGNWSLVVEDGNTVLNLTGYQQVNLWKEWTDYAFKFRFKRIDGSLHVNFRITKPGEGWNRYFVGVSGKSAISGRVDNLEEQLNNSFQKLKKNNFGFDNTNWHTLEIRCYSNIINIYMDDELLIKYKDSESPFLFGGIGFETHTGGAPIQPEFLIDDVEIKIITENDIIYP